mmetsp:Transcript_5679/g.13082  ORF Transcript_5679/g.13082 Transcript_5679/m.13082 type:complete len:303 (+) Transcript_5679:455-1363(+)
MRRRVLRHRQCLHHPRVGKVGAAAEVDEGSAAVRRARRSFRHLIHDGIGLEGRVGEHLEGLIFGHHQPLEHLLLLCDPRYLLFELRCVACFDSRMVGSAGIVEEPPVCRWSDHEEGAKRDFERLPEDVRTRVPEHLLAPRVVEFEELERARRLENTREIPGLSIDQTRDGRVCEPRRNAASKSQGRRLELHAVHHLAVRERDLDGLLLPRARLLLGSHSRYNPLVHSEAVRHEARQLLLNRATSRFRARHRRLAILASTQNQNRTSGSSCKATRFRATRRHAPRDVGFALCVEVGGEVGGGA